MGLKPDRRRSTLIVPLLPGMNGVTKSIARGSSWSETRSRNPAKNMSSGY